MTLCLAFLLSLVTAAPAAASSRRRRRRAAAITHYLQGHATGDASHMRMAFLPTAHIEGVRDGTFAS